MSSSFRSLLVQLGAVALIVLAFVFITDHAAAPAPRSTATTASSTQVAAVASVEATSTPRSEASTTKTTSSPTQKPAAKPAATPATTTPATSDSGDKQVERIQDPYTTPPVSFEAINVAARAALVNILCMPRSGTLKPISGSGVIIDTRGIILTNAHVAQYVLLSESPRIDLSCFIRTGAPAVERWRAAVLYVPPVWVKAHFSDVNADKPTGTGEHDYALLLITSTLDGSPLPASFPALSPDTREGISFVDDRILAASYPAEFLGGFAAQTNLHPNTSVTTIKQLLTFGSGSIDVLSLGGIIEAQSGSSGGAIVNAWDRLVGVITTTSAGDTTGERDLRAITLSYINRDLEAQSGKSLSTLLAEDPLAALHAFTQTTAVELLSLYLKTLLH